MNCQGNETALSQCDSVPWGKVRECKSAHTAGVLCYVKNGKLTNLWDISVGMYRRASFRGIFNTRYYRRVPAFWWQVKSRNIRSDSLSENMYLVIIFQ